MATMVLVTVCGLLLRGDLDVARIKFPIVEDSGVVRNCTRLIEPHRRRQNACHLPSSGARPRPSQQEGSTSSVIMSSSTAKSATGEYRREAHLAFAALPNRIKRVIPPHPSLSPQGRLAEGAHLKAPPPRVARSLRERRPGCPPLRG
jgi:hypothetical protein